MLFVDKIYKRKTVRGNKKIITILNSLLADELSTINQYMVHSEMCNNWAESQ